ncbi:tRNA (Guanine37-N1) -methyltransferase [Enhygromyxa salina]|uniref:tRNA (guanine-N(1)-)-methyltransferase n=1 Tax=Enhygromyxa salina TaxID=215803 RepID=A0A0C1Z6L8_9BACT|nr:tRNA (guanosine(37)-N1)-methyltransferase TrmD [Enhygromyxa salina]KIG13254.1 tRNA (Guanine37-N1) -methyltransferase [Enhygromyxa salina]
MSTIEFEVFTIFPAAIQAFVDAGLMGKAIARDLVAVHCTDYRSFTTDRHRSVDDAPFGGGAGMVMKPEPVAAALEAVSAARGPMHTILLTPSGARFDQRVAERLASSPRIALLCGRYEGIDDRIREHFVDECLSIGDFVLNGGEVAAAVIIEAVARLREGVLGNPESTETESFAIARETSVQHGRESWTHSPLAARAVDPQSNSQAWDPGLVLEHPHYTRPAEFRGHAVPPVLLGGDHQAIERWRRRTACLRTWALRPELRPRWSLPHAHPIHLAAPADQVGDAAGELAQLAADAGASFTLIGPRAAGGHTRMRDLKQLRRSLRKRHGREPQLIGVGQCGPTEPERGPRLILDVLAFESGEPPAPLLLWFGDSPAPGAHAWMALDPARDRSPGITLDPRLAIASSLIDISQPQPAPQAIAALARSALAAMRAEGLLRC